MVDYWKDLRPGEVKALGPGENPPVSSLVTAFQAQGASAADAIVLSGFLGRSDIMQRTIAYLERARRIAQSGAESVTSRTLTSKIAEDQDWDATKAATQAARLVEAREQAEAAGLKGMEKDERAAAEAEGRGIDAIDLLVGAVEQFKDVALPHIPWRLYLTPRLDTYVDFHRSSLLAYRREAKTERQDACTVWLKIFEEGARDPIPYRVVHESMIGPSFSAWLGGDVVDDYFAGGGGGSAWGDQSSIFGGNKPGTGIFCGNKTGTGIRCME